MMTSLTFLFCLLAAASAWSPYLDDGSSRIVGGSDADRGAWPWQVLLQKYSSGRWSHICGGVIVDKRHVTTAAHCVDGDAPRVLRIVAGEHNKGSSGNNEQAIVTSAIHVHEQWNANGVGFPNDVAVLTLSSDIDLSGDFAKAIDLAPASADFTGQKCYLTGWGRLGGSLPTPDVLQEVLMPVISTSECSNRFSSWPGSVTSKHICAYEYGKSACMGDSGGPMSCELNGKYVLAGVTSWGSSSCTSTPSVYTKVAAYHDWIADKAGL